jgi:hypothetical protein
MALLVDQLLQTLENIKGNGYFVASGNKDFIPMGLEIKGVDEISFPIAANQAKAMIKVAHKAPFGKGSQTIVDENVRSAWEIDASKISFKNKKWAACLEDMLKEVKVGLGLDDKNVSANLYKLLIYEQGDFFLPHKDSEKEAGMFGTLIVGLPSKHSGGPLHIRFNKQEQIIDFSDSDNEYKFPFTAFYADCEHEVKPLESGYRICLVYNLIQKKGEEKIRIEDTSQYIEQLSKQLEQVRTHKPMVILLGHQYTPSNFSLDTLKYHDRPRAQALLTAADKAGLYAKLGLLTCYTHGDLVQNYTSRKKKSRYYGDDFDFDEADGIMGDDIYDEHIVINHWGTGDALPALSDLAFDEDEILSNLELRDGEPIEKQAEGYTGNAGMTMEYWYHYGAVVFWPQKEHFNILSEQSISSKLDWFKYYLNHWNPSEMEEIKKILRGMIETSNSDKHKDPDNFDALVSLLIKLNDTNFMASPDCQTLLVNIFNKIDVKRWVELIESFDLTIFEDIFDKVAALKKVKKIKHLTDVLKALRLLDSSNIQAFVVKQIAQLPNYLNDFDLPQKATNRTYYYEKEKEIPTVGHLKNILDLSLLKNDDNTWLERMTFSLTTPLTREYVNTILSPLLLSLAHSEKLVLAQLLATVCKKDLIAHTNIKPTPPTDWSREVPKPKYQKDVWDMLTPFLTSPTERVFDYSKPEAYRKQMENAINSVVIDIRMETIRKGSPHTLRLTKTQSAYEKELKYWHEDVALLEKMEKTYPL